MVRWASGSPATCGYHIASTIRTCGPNAPPEPTLLPPVPVLLPFPILCQLPSSMSVPCQPVRTLWGQCQEAATWGSHLLPELRPADRVHSTAPCPTATWQLHWTGELGGGSCCGLAMQPGLLSVLFSFNVCPSPSTGHFLHHSSFGQVLEAYLVCH